jgi:hypothetical protein
LGDTTGGISWIEDGIEDYRGTGSMIDLPYLLSLKAEALYLADRTPEAIQTIREAEAPVERFDALVECRTAPAARCVSHGYGFRRDAANDAFQKAEASDVAFGLKSSR